MKCVHCKRMFSHADDCPQFLIDDNDETSSKVYVVYAFMDCLDSIWDSEKLANNRLAELRTENGDCGYISEYTLNEKGNC